MPLEPKTLGKFEELPVFQEKPPARSVDGDTKLGKQGSSQQTGLAGEHLSIMDSGLYSPQRAATQLNVGGNGASVEACQAD